MSRVKVASLATLPEGTATEFVSGETSIAVCRVNGEIYAIDGVCPHNGGPLGEGALHGKWLVCPWHAWELTARLVRTTSILTCGKSNSPSPSKAKTF